MGSASSSSPIFVFGALRSGTTLLRLMLKSHPGIQSPGEADFLFDHIERDGDGWHYDRDALERDRILKAKNLTMQAETQGAALAVEMVEAMAALAPGLLSLNIHRNAPKMQALFPDAKIIHLLRDPRDVARSSIGMGWAGNSYFGVDHWVGTEAGWEDVSYPEEQVLTVYFEELMANLEVELTRICDFLGLGFEPAMLKYYENSTYGPPDPSIAQKWREKASTREVALIEGRCGPLLAARGYTLAGEPAVPDGLELARLSMQSRIKRWQFNLRRYGFPLFFGQHAARVFGLKGLARKLADRQEEIRIASLK
ncbi:sulfotransferase [Rhodobacteraceae bacterium]|nr:sulfotransferase [Paracoccaceae bacterium]